MPSPAAAENRRVLRALSRRLDTERSPQALTYLAPPGGPQTDGTTWQIVLSKPLASPFPKFTALDGDLFDNTATNWKNIKTAGFKTICYFSAGSYEEWRSDKDKFHSTNCPGCLGDPLDSWPGERWVNVKSTKLKEIMKACLDLAKQKGCDAVDPDNIDAYNNDGGGLGLTSYDAVNYVRFLATEAHNRDMVVDLKNGIDIVGQVLDVVDFQVNEQCQEFSDPEDDYYECRELQPFIEKGKPVCHIEYREGTPSQSDVRTICGNVNSKGFSTLIKQMALDEARLACS